MSRALDDDLLPRHGEPIDPVAMARKDLKTNLPKRFWKEVTIGFGAAGMGGFGGGDRPCINAFDPSRQFGP